MSKNKKVADQPLSSLLAISRASYISVGTLSSFNSTSENPQPVPVRVHDMTVRGSISNYGDAYGSKKKGDALANINSPNPQTIEAAYLPIEHDRVRLSFSMKLIPITVDSISCNNAVNTERLARFIHTYTEKDGFQTLASLMAWAMAAGLPLWRNRYGFNRTVKVWEVGTSNQRDCIYDGSVEGVNAKKPDEDLSGKRQALIEAFAQTLKGEKPILLLNVEMESTVGFGMEVFPSQDFVVPDSNKSKKSRLLFQVNDGVQGKQAALHPQKIWAALRMIDVWHDDFDRIGPLTVEPLGYSHQHQQAYRKPDSKKDLYSCLVDIDDLTAELEAGEVSGRSHFLMANVMRGGVFSATPDDKKSTSANKGDDE